MQNNYKGWPLLDSLPDGWQIDKTAGSPLSGYVFCTNGKSVLNGQQRALLLVRKPQAEMRFDCEHQPSKEDAQPVKKQEWQHFDASCARTINELARERFKARLLNDILCDLMICEIEGWCKKEYIDQIKKLIGSLAQGGCIDIDQTKQMGQSKK
jgi:hypothetical protein